MKWIAREFVFAFAFVSFSASAATQHQKVETRDEVWAEATNHIDRITTEFPDMTVIMETVGGALTVYYFSKPSSVAYPTWIREQHFPDGRTDRTKSCDTCHDNIMAFANWTVPSDKALIDGFRELMGQKSN